MKRIILVLFLAVATLLAALPAQQAEARHWRSGWGRPFGGFWGPGFFGGPRFGFGHRHFGFHGFYGGFHRPFFGHYHYPRAFLYSRPYFGGFYPAYPVFHSGFGPFCSTFDHGGGIVAFDAAPLYARADAVYGPDAMKEFMGVDRDFAKGPLAPPRFVDLPPAVDRRLVVAAPLKPEKEAVASNAEARARAARFVSFGDGQFSEQQYHSAAQRYRDAISAAPDMADPYFRQGFAYIASNRHDLAVKAFRRGLALDPLWVHSAFRIDDLYGRSKLAKNAHIEAIAKAALADRRNADHLFLLGLLLHFDGQQERAVKFFQHAEKLAGESADHITAFLVPPELKPEDAI